MLLDKLMSNFTTCKNLPANFVKISHRIKSVSSNSSTDSSSSEYSTPKEKVNADSETVPSVLIVLKNFAFKSSGGSVT